MSTLEMIVKKFPITTAEYVELEKKLGKLCSFAAWQLHKKNSKNAMTNEVDDDIQELNIALIRAGSYFKRQVFIEDSLAALQKHAKDRFIARLVTQLTKLWTDRRQHGANRQRFGDHQEELLEKLLEKYVPQEERPDRHAHLNIDAKFMRYAKRIIWNAQKALGKHITKEKSWRNGLVSISEFDFLASC